MPGSSTTELVVKEDERRRALGRRPIRLWLCALGRHAWWRASPGQVKNCVRCGAIAIRHYEVKPWNR